ncbi:MAG: hypothetical protein ACRDE5_11965 [Ginsengibacter sp.]
MEKLFTIELTTVNSVEAIIGVLKVLQVKQTTVKDFCARLWQTTHSYRNILIEISSDEARLRSVMQHLQSLEEVMAVTAKATGKKLIILKAMGVGRYFTFLAAIIMTGCTAGRIPVTDTRCSYQVECEGIFGGTEVVSSITGVAPAEIICRHEGGWGNPVSSVRLRFEGISLRTLQEIQGQLFTCPGMWMIHIEKE